MNHCFLLQLLVALVLYKVMFVRIFCAAALFDICSFIIKISLTVRSGTEQFDWEERKFDVPTGLLGCRHVFRDLCAGTGLWEGRAGSRVHV